MYFFKVVYLIARRCSLLTEVFIVMLPCLSAVAQPNLSPSTAPESIVFFQFEDRATDPFITRLLTLGIRPSGEFHIGYKRVDEKGTSVEHKEIDGRLDTAELDQLKATLITVEIANNVNEKMNIGYSTDLKRGWLGLLSINRDGRNQTVNFTSLRPESHPTRSVALNRLVTFIFDLKNLTLRKIDVEHR